MSTMTTRSSALSMLMSISMMSKLQISSRRNLRRTLGQLKRIQTLTLRMKSQLPWIESKPLTPSIDSREASSSGEVSQLPSFPS